ncbi:MAG: DMT family transporter [Alphaproteobacteria bacterium]
MPVLPDAARGALWMLFSACCYVSSATLMRGLGDAYSTFLLTFIRTLVAAVILLPLFLRAGRGKLVPRRMGLIVLSSAFTYVGVLFWFYGAAHVPVANFFALQFTTPLFTILLATLILGQRNDPAAWVATIAGFAGVLIILRPGLIPVSTGALATLASCVAYASINTTVKSLSRDVSTIAIVFWTNLLIVPLAMPLAIANWQMPKNGDWLVILAISVLTTVAFVTVTRAISLADARIVQPVNFMRMPIGALIGWLVFSTLPDLWTWIGALVIFVASTYAVSRGARHGSK